MTSYNKLNTSNHLRNILVRDVYNVDNTTYEENVDLSENLILESDGKIYFGDTDYIDINNVCRLTETQALTNKTYNGLKLSQIGTETIKIGDGIGEISELGNHCIAIGKDSQKQGGPIAETGGDYVISIGSYSALVNPCPLQTVSDNILGAICVGFESGYDHISSGSIAIGHKSGYGYLGENSVSIGAFAGQTNMNSHSVSIGYRAGNSEQGLQCIALGNKAGETNQHDNTIIINANSTALNSSGTNRCHISPIRNIAKDYMLLYDNDTKEVVCNRGFSLLDNMTYIINDNDETKRLRIECGTIATGQTRTWTVPDSSDTFVGLTSTQTITNKTLQSCTLQDSTVIMADNSDPLKKLAFELSGITSNTTRTLTVPNSSGTICLTGYAQTLTNKILSCSASSGLLDSLADIENESNYSIRMKTYDSGASSSAGIGVVDTTLGVPASSITFKTNDASANYEMNFYNAMNGGTISQNMKLSGSQFQYYDNTATTYNVVLDTKTQTLSNKTLSGPKMGNDSIFDPNGNEILTLAYEASAANHFKLSNKPLTNGPILEAVGDDTNISIHLRPKGTSLVTIQDGTDNTKFLKFQVNAISSNTTRTWAFIDTDDTFCGLTSTQTLTNKTLTQPILSTGTPASASSSGTTGTIVWDSNYIYICTGTNTWKRAALSTW